MDQPIAVLDPVVTESAPPGAPRSRPRWPGILSFALGLLTVAGLATGIALATSDLYLAATYTAWAAVGVGALAAVVALIALIAGLGRGTAAAGLVLGVVANPLVLTPALDAIGGLWS
jgi:hypothetical protein